MNLLENAGVQCPYCGEWIELMVDCSVSRQDYIEDCSVCCKPIALSISIGHGNLDITARQENE
jgi:hypothetical protein